MDAVHLTDDAAAGVAAAIADPARARILYCLMDGKARTSTELAAVADVGASTTSAHLSRLKAANLITVLVQGRHRYHSLAGRDVAAVLEALSVVAGGARSVFTPRTPSRLRAARTCYDHLAGEVGVQLHDRFEALGYLLIGSRRRAGGYELTSAGAEALAALGVDVAATRALRRRFAYGCLDWSERRAHLGGGLGAALLKVALGRKWVVQDLDSRALSVTRGGRGEMAARFGVAL
jgi:DNA-binding transcriptional ArsR family regulator